MTEPLTIKRWIDDEGFSLRDADETPVVTVATKALGYKVDPEALRDWIDDQRPNPRYTVAQLAVHHHNPWQFSVDDSVVGLDVARFKGRQAAQEYADWLNERMADE